MCEGVLFQAESFPPSDREMKRDGDENQVKQVIMELFHFVVAVAVYHSLGVMSSWVIVTP